ncbi:MAG: methylated-DNA--[protein]-cysteine S-methyltransferase [Pseudomonadota bacterium]
MNTQVKTKCGAIAAAPCEQHLNQDRWQAILQRHPQDDFVYAVVSTGIVCHTGCPSRAPNKENVRCFATVGDALLAGFRPCKRCMQGDAVARVEAVCRNIEQAEEQTLGEIAALHGLSSRQIQRLFRQVLGITPKQYELQCRFNRFMDYVAEGATITDAVYQAGFRSSSSMYGQLRQRLGMNSQNWRNAGAEQLIFFACQTTSLGEVLIAQTLTGLCFAGFFDTVAESREALFKQYAQATHVAVAAHQLEPLASAFEMAINGDYNKLCKLPLDIQGTAFQSAVWEAARQIPVGRRVSYRELAEAINKPQHSRAVANALAGNQIALAIPCHRVVPANGEGTGGYRWGADRKQALLARER